MSEATPTYRIFLSSTAIDLEDHRKKVIDAILRLEYLPIEMGTFNALPDNPVEVCEKKVKTCNALVVIIAHRYGWVPETGNGDDGKKSITWIEVETALGANIPVFAFLVDKDFGWTQPKEQDLIVDAEGEEQAKVIKKIKALKDFHAFLENEAGLTRETFNTPDNLAMKVTASLSNWADKATSVPIEVSHTFRVVHPLQPAPHFRGRNNTLKSLKQWWEDPVNPDRVRSLVAIGGTGKTAVVEHFLKNIKKDKLRGSVLVWSFYEEPNTDKFLREACFVFAGEEGDGAGGRMERLQRALTGNEPHLLVLDGLERVQAEGKTGHARGDLEDHRIKNLLRSIASGLGRTRALITSRFKLTDLKDWENAGYRSHNLNDLDKQTAIAVLKAWKVKGNKEELQTLAESVGRHAISVSVLGSYLRDFCDGDFKCAEEFKLEEVSEEEPQAAKLGRILAGYAKNLPDDERELLIRLSVFPKGVSVDILVYIVDAGGEIAGALIGCNQTKLNKLAQKLRNRGLVYAYKLRNSITYTAHPFLREYFRDLLGVPPEKIHEAVRSKLAIGLNSKPETKPTDAETLDRYETLIEHSIGAGHFQEAYDLFQNAMGGVAGSIHLYHTLGDCGRIIRIMSLFSADGTPQHLAPQLSITDRSLFINHWGLAAYTLGDLRTAKCCFDIVNELYRKNKNWEYLSQTLQNSALVAMARGAFLLAQKLLRDSLEYAEADNKYVREGSHGFLAATCHALGDISETQDHFAKATEISGEPLFSADGIYEAEHIFALGNKETAYERTKANLATCESIRAPGDTSPWHTLLGQLSLPDSPSEARNHLQKARDWTDQSGHMDCILRAHRLAAEIAYCAGDYPAALSEATTGLNLAEGCGFGWFAIDLLILLAKIHLAIPDARAALGNARKALDRSQHPDCRYAWGEADAAHLAGIAHKMLKEPELAKKRFKSALKIRQRIQHPGLDETRDYLKELK